MASPYWRRNRSVEQVLTRHADRIGFFQLVRMVLQTHNGKSTDLHRQLEDHLRFVADLDYDYPPCEVRSAQLPTAAQGKAQLVVTGFGLAGREGPLPEPFWEWINDNVRDGDYAFRDFVDLFNNRFLALRYMVKEQCNPNLSHREPRESDTGKLLLGLSGNVFPEKRQQLGVSDAILLAETARLADCRVSAHALRMLIEHLPGVRVLRIRPLQGAWLRVDATDHSRLGVSGGNQVLGSTAVLGRRVWDQQAVVEILLAPMTSAQFSRYLPEGEDHGKLVAMIQMMSDGEWDCRVRLQLLAQDLHGCRLSAKEGAAGNNRLGLGSWLKNTKEFSGRCQFMC